MVYPNASRFRWPGRPELSNLRKDGRSQRCALANNLAANAADMVKAVHDERTMMRCVGTVKARKALRRWG
jgi:hypothetical protein